MEQPTTDARAPNTDVIERFTARLFDRYHESYVLVALLTAGVFVMSTVGVPATIGASLWLGFGLADGLLFGAVILIAHALAIALAAATIWRSTLQPIHQWSRGRHDDPVLVWSALQRLPTFGAVRVAVIVTPIVFITAILSTRWSTLDDGVHPLALGAAGMAAVLAAAAMGAVGLPILLRPLGRELFLHLSSAPTASRRPAIRVQLLMGSAALLLSSSLLGASTVVRVDGRTEQLMTTILVSVALALYLSGVMYVAYVQPVLRPIDDLIVGAQRVGSGDFDEPVAVAASDELGDLALAFNDMQLGLAQRERLRTAFGSYVDPALTARLLEGDDHVFPGEELEVSVFFVDVRDFTGYVEREGPARALHRLNALYELLVPVIHAHEGHANKFTGDGLLAVFGAPDPIDDHADRAVAASIAIQRLVRERFGETLRLGIGINTGSVIAGTVGGGGRVEFMLIGDPVNAADRVEALTKVTGDSILLTGETRAAMTRRRWRLIPRGEHMLRGRAATTEIYAVPSTPGA